MSYKFESMMKILNMINAKDVVTRDSLAKDFRVTIRTADRYISTLRSAGFPITYNDERGSYVFEEGYSLSKAAFTGEEMLALGLARSLASKFGPRTGKVLESIERKMSVCSMSLPTHIVFSDDKMPPLVEENFRKLNQAILSHQQVEMTYATAYRDGERAERTIDPHYLLFQEGLWYCRAYCRLKKEPRLFALDRMEDVNLLDKNFLPKPEITPDEMKEAFGAVVGCDPVKVVLRFDKCCKPYLKRYHFPGQKETALPDGKIEISFKTTGIIGVKHWLYRFIPNVEIVAPKELKEEMKQELLDGAGKI